MPMLVEGQRKLEADLARYKAERPEVIDAIERKRARMAICPENAEYHAAKVTPGPDRGDDC